MARGVHETEVVVLGAGPGGYSAAFHASDLGKKVTLIDERSKPGGVCLHIGCIPSKALLHAAEVLDESRHAEAYGIVFPAPEIDLDRLRTWKDSIVDQLTGGLGQLAKARRVTYFQARAQFEDSSTLLLEGSEVERVKFDSAILATGSRPSSIPGIALDSDRLMDSTGALELRDTPQTLLIVGGGYIGLELGTVYAALGSKVTVVEMLDGLLPGVDRDLVRPLARRLEGTFEGIHLETRVAAMTDTKDGVTVQFEGAREETQEFERVLVSVGRTPNSQGIGLENTGVRIGKGGFVEIDRQCRTAESHIFAIGDVAGQPMLAHKAMREGKVAAEVIAGKNVAFENVAIPAVVFTNPEIAWTGLSEHEAAEKGIEVKVGRFPWAASGRALTLGRSEGLTKILFEKDSGRILGVGIVGPSAGELIAEGTLAVEMAALAEDLALTIHTHPTLSETVGEVAEMFLGHATHIFRK